MGLRATMASKLRRMRSATSLRLKAAASAKVMAPNGCASARPAEPGVRSPRPRLSAVAEGGGREAAWARAAGALRLAGRAIVSSGGWAVGRRRFVVWSGSATNSRAGTAGLGRTWGPASETRRL